MPTVTRTVATTTDATRVMTYLADFENATEWDSGTVSCVRISGDGGPGTQYRNESSFAGRTVELIYTVEERTDLRFVIVGRNATTTSRDTIVVRPHGGGALVIYTADFTLAGPARLLGPIMSLLLQRLASTTAATLKAALDALP
ncbi:SRPBCC family protein [Arsenicicoccus piscis]|uniref:Polyketide cyclase n=1 Tax=Arsenicicoccus piscis TaxID=673954 RepID=A0ABQ6HNH0_9MICO|nr:SRPBCC family protein [Arsenicicoccus piscis]MCH8629046.1 SRPBCC family protein [Arsenicicoccus piscis]GMA19670.1 hypothetical protein GCM10025862_16910 [Arsenicicoccus piscis]